MSRINIYNHSVFTTRKKDRYPVTRCGVIFILSGSVTYLNSQDEMRTLESGQFTIFHSDEFRELRSQPDEQGFLAKILTFEPSLLQQFYPQVDQKAASQNVSAKPLEQSDTMAASILDLLIQAVETSNTDTAEALTGALLTEIVSVSPDHSPLLHRACNQSTTQKVIRFIELNIENEVSLENTARFLGMSTATLKRRLSAEGLSFSQILKVKRVNFAATKLRLTSKSIAQIAFESGFKSAAHFSTAFKGVQGITPKEFRQRIAENR